MSQTKLLQNTLKDLVSIISLKIRQEEELRKTTTEKIRVKQLEYGALLLQLRTRVESGEAGKVRWWDWYDQSFAYSRRTAEHAMNLASQDDPQLAHEQAKAKNAEVNKAYRKRMKQIIEDEISANRASRDAQNSETGSETSTKSSKPKLKIVANSDPTTEVQKDLLAETIELVRQMNPPTYSKFLLELNRINPKGGK